LEYVKSGDINGVIEVLDGNVLNKVEGDLESAEPVILEKRKVLLKDDKNYDKKMKEMKLKEEEKKLLE